MKPQPSDYMKRALQLARRAAGRTEPNPMVGCVLARRNCVIGEGYHRRYGGGHAEVDALRSVGGHARGATCYVTLEPCNHHGKTPPCTNALIEAGVKDVIMGTLDPNPRVNGSGLRRLRRAGLTASVGLLRVEADALIAPYRTTILQDRTYVIAKWAQSLDGRIATRSGDSKWISGPAARHMVQRIRARVDAVIVGIQTVLRDDPRLDCRDVRPRRIARRIILDTHARTPHSSHVVQTAETIPTLVFASQAVAKTRRARRLVRAGVDLRVAPLREDRVSLTRVLRQLARDGSTNALIEGGGEVLGSAFDADVVDEAHVFVSPCLLGGANARPAIAGRGLDRVADPRNLHHASTTRVGQDMLYRFERLAPV
jgi:diaminohydroxyphosphoribosylaminopyrimidine deaminase/5-amino-6-(5-phosphoribosylamino)uracil reductase